MKQQSWGRRTAIQLIIILFFLLSSARNSSAQNSSQPVQAKGIYFGQVLPGETPLPFAPDILNSLSVWVEATEFSPDGKKFFLAVGDASYSTAKLYYSNCVDGIWTPFAEVPFLNDFTFSHEPVFSSDGAALTFTSIKGKGTIDLWSVSKTEQGWGTPVALPAPINSEGKDYRGCYMKNGDMYFGSNRSGMMQVYKAYKDSSNTLKAELLGYPINAKSYEGDPCIAPDGHYLIFYSARDGKSADLYVSFKDVNGEWGTPINLGDKFNTTDSDEYGAHLSSDGKYLFFTRHSTKGNGIYWVASSAIEKLKPQH